MAFQIATVYIGKDTDGSETPLSDMDVFMSRLWLKRLQRKPSAAMQQILTKYLQHTPTTILSTKEFWVTLANDTQQVSWSQWQDVFTTVVPQWLSLTTNARLQIHNILTQSRPTSDQEHKDLIKILVPSTSSTTPLTDNFIKSMSDVSATNKFLKKSFRG